MTIPSGEYSVDLAKRSDRTTEVTRTGPPWIGHIPRHWAVRRLKTIADVETSNVDKKSVDGDVPVRLCNYTDVYYNEKITSEINFMEATATPEQVRRFTLRKGDVLITKDSESWTDIAVPALIAEDLDAVLCGYHLAHIRPRAGTVGAFLARAISAQGVREQFQVAADGITRFGLGGDEIRNALFPVPPEAEQRAIARLLDTETEAIDHVIAKHEEMLKLLASHRTSVLTASVSRGVENEVATKDSGDPTLRVIPAHWPVMRVRRVLSSIEQGWSPECENREALPAEWGVLKAGCVNGGVFNEMEHKALPADLTPIPVLEVKEGDLLMSRASGSRELVGSVAVVPACRANLMLCDKIFRLHVDRTQMSAEFLAMTLSSRLGRSQIESALSGGSGLANNIPQSVVKEIVLPVPPLNEQLRIVNFVHQRLAELARAAMHATEMISRLRELRTALITAAVTGKLDLRTRAP